MTPEMDAVVTGIGVVVPEAGDDPATWFDVRTRLGGRGYRYLPPAAQYLVAAARDALAGAGDVPEDRRGAVLATNNGLTATLDEMDRTVADQGADDLSPARAPFFAINVLGNRLASDHGLKGFALTVTSPRVAGLEAVQSGLRALSAGRCEALLVAAAEDGLPDRAPEHGAVALAFEPRAAAEARGARPYGACRVRTMFAPPRLLGDAAGRDRIGAAIRAAAKDLGNGATLPAEVVDDGSEVADLACRALADAAGHAAEIRRTPAGNGCLTPMTRLAELLTGPPGDRLIVAAAGEGNLALARVEGSRSC
ncbi:beta-ketoacyl synthase N-terminal-like domain-containing protein [Actinomadura sp. KC06]|uniref:beta-ketoacyl synthase N-terminal-like domain-containing protein n=1 Tax=Actinomadura sp. KC06 TaxID=2530369 RepID=UPI001A9E4630|nr:beta-ketoacyl synthase N-terminal-like domain-containing protein [Actinomadura sp. KC06]